MVSFWEIILMGRKRKVLIDFFGLILDILRFFFKFVLFLFKEKEFYVFFERKGGLGKCY